MSRWICVDDIGSMETRTDQEMIDSAPSIDIVRCKECKYFDDKDYGEPTRYCTWHESVVNADDFCSYGERRSECQKDT